MSLSMYDYDNTHMLRRFETYKIVPTPEEHALRFLGEVLAVMTSIHAEPAEAFEALREFFSTLKPYGRPEDFDCGELPVPKSVRLFTSGIELYFFFRAWLRKRGIDAAASEPEKRAA
jgi:hypothetical protein